MGAGSFPVGFICTAISWLTVTLWGHEVADSSSTTTPAGTPNARCVAASGSR